MDTLDMEELAVALANVKNEDYERSDIDTALFEKYNIDFEQFEQLMGDLWPLLDLGVSPLTNSVFIGFADKKQGLWLSKKDFTSSFMANVIQWLSEGNPPTEMGKGFLKTITNHDKPEYDITIKRAVYLERSFLEDENNRGKIIATGGTSKLTKTTEVRWVAKVGDGYHDWAIYYDHMDKNVEWIKTHGVKIVNDELIRELVPCSDEAFNCYRK